MHISPERNLSKTSCFRSSDQNASVARIRSTATVLISTNSEVADISSRGLQQKKQIIFQQEKQQVVCVSKYVSWHGKKVVLFLFFSWNKILDDIRPCLLATSKFGNFPPGCLNPRRDQGNTLLWKQKKNVQSTKTISFCFLKKSFITIFWVPNTVGMMSFIISFTILPQSAERSGCWVVILLKDRRSSTFSLLN